MHCGPYTWPIKDKKIDNKDSKQPPEYRVTVYDAPKNKIQEKAGDLDKSETMAAVKLEKCVNRFRSFPLIILSDSRRSPQGRAVSQEGGKYATHLCAKEKIGNGDSKATHHSRLRCILCI